MNPFRVQKVSRSLNQQRYQQQPRQQAPQQVMPQNGVKKIPRFDPIPMRYAELFPALIEKNLVQTRAPPLVPEKLPVWYRSDISCASIKGHQVMTLSTVLH